MATGRSRAIAIAVLIVAGVAVLGAGAYQMLQGEDGRRVVPRPDVSARLDRDEAPASAPEPAQPQVQPQPPPPPKPPSEGKQLRAELIGKTHLGGLAISGWEDLGGGLMGGGLASSHYRRSDGAALVLIEAYTPAPPGATQATFRVRDVLFIPRVGNDETISFYCRQSGGSSAQKTVAVVKVDFGKEWWTDVRQAWSIEHGSGRITPIGSNGVKCENEGWGGD